MRVYLDVCCLNRPFDDQSQTRIRLESEAVILILDMCARGEHGWVSSEAIEEETLRDPDEERRSRVWALLARTSERLVLDEACLERARALVALGFGAMDAVHLAAAEAARCDILLTTDDDLVRKAGGLDQPLRVRVENPVRWVAEVSRS
jgi:predicted nucleic acid-binding protein